MRLLCVHGFLRFQDGRSFTNPKLWPLLFLRRSTTRGWRGLSHGTLLQTQPHQWQYQHGPLVPSPRTMAGGEDILFRCPPKKTQVSNPPLLRWSSERGTGNTTGSAGRVSWIIMFFFLLHAMHVDMSWQQHISRHHYRDGIANAIHINYKFYVSLHNTLVIESNIIHVAKSLFSGVSDGC